MKRIVHIVTRSLVKKSVKWSMAIIGLISTVMAVMGVSLSDLLPKDSGYLVRLIVFAALFVVLAILAAVVAYHRSKSGIHLTINGMDVDAVVGDLFVADGVKVIPFDEYFDIQVDDKVISRNSLNGILLRSMLTGIPSSIRSKKSSRACWTLTRPGMVEFAIPSAPSRITASMHCSLSRIWTNSTVHTFAVANMRNACSTCGTS